jgi:high frequency lysogenization protein
MNSAHHYTHRDRAIALAGLYQAVRLVQQTGQGLPRDAAATHTCLASIFITDPPETAAVFGHVPALRAGLDVLARQLGNQAAGRALELTAYAVTLLHLERKLSRNRRMLNRLADGIAAIGSPPADVMDDAVIGALAELYQQTISTLSPRVMVRGEPEILANPATQRMIRALLLAGIRAAVLWRQCGGNRLQLVFRRRALLDAARGLLQEADRRA